MKFRLAAHATVIFVVWPLLTIAAAAFELRFVPYISVPWHQGFAAASASVLLLAPDFALIGAGLLALSLTVFGVFGRQTGGRRLPLKRVYMEPISMLGAIACGICLWYPGVLSHAVLVPLWGLPSVVVLGLVMFVTSNIFLDVAPRGRRLSLALALGVVGLAAPAAPIVAGVASSRSGPPPELVLLGIDSLAQTNDVTPFRRWVASQGGAWYERPVAPGLLTNAVWASVMTMRPVREHGIFHTFQSFPPGSARLLENAREAGFYTVSFFSDQLTSSIGSQAGFDSDRSGPVGWRQLALATTENSSMFLPLFRPMLPRTPWSVSPPNHAGTFTYDLDRELREILTSGAPGRRTFVAAHSTYLHMPVYPRLVDLSWSELSRVALERAGSLRDRTLDWQDTDAPEDPVPLHQWKRARLQRVLAEAVARTSFFERGGKLLMFSDHGERRGLSPQSFKEERYHRVVLASIGLPAQAVDEPISLLDIGSLLGLEDSARKFDPVVEFASAPESLWPRLVATSRLRWSGSVDLAPEILGLVFKDLRSYRPWTTGPGVEEKHARQAR